MGIKDWPLFDDFVYFAKAQMEIGDFDCVHPMMQRLTEGMDREDALWMSILYMTFYNEASAWMHFRENDRFKFPTFRYPMDTQRRNLYRDEALEQYLDSWERKAEAHGGLYNYLTKDFKGIPDLDWMKLEDAIGGIWGNGRWAIYTQADMFQKVNGLPVWPTDLGNENSSGPRDGLLRICNCEDTTKILDIHGDDIFEWFKANVTTSIFYLDPGHWDYAILESLLCDFSGLCRGRYYSGRNIDRIMLRISKCKAVMDDPRELDFMFGVRQDLFDHRVLGELNGWDGINSERLKTYKLTGAILCSQEDR